MYHVKYSKPLSLLENKIKDSTLKQLMHESNNINEFISTLGDSFFEIENALHCGTNLKYALIRNRIEYECEIKIYTGEYTFVINTNDLLSRDDNIEGLNFLIKLINNLDSYDLVIAFD